jgi:2-polyprenyl-3-methyl-5-hydroxy-6-metoxy-1,4-benzoquinol methylase
MTSQQQIEIGFWRELFKSKGTPEMFLEQRKEDWDDFAKNLPEMAEYLKNGAEKHVLEVGCGLVSPLEFADSKAEITAIDPLVGAYQDTIDLMGRPVRYLGQSGEAIAFDGETFDAVTCLNVLDHTPNPDTMVAEIRRVLKTGGKLFFEINYDPALSPAHYGLWNDECVAKALKDFKLVTSRKDERPDYGQTRYWAVYEK